MNQSYQEAVAEVREELIKNGDKIYNKDYQQYFFDLKQKYPERFKKVLFNEDEPKPFSRDLENMLRDLSFRERCMFAKRNISMEQINKIFSL